MKWLIYNIGLISVIHQQELIIGVHMSAPSWDSLPPPTLSHSSRLLRAPVWVHWIIQKISIGYPFYICSCICFHATSFFSSSLSYPLPLSISLFSMSASSLLPCEYVHQYHLSRSHKYALVNICFSLSDLLQFLY